MKTVNSIYQNYLKQIDKIYLLNNKVLKDNILSFNTGIVSLNLNI